MSHLVYALGGRAHTSDPDIAQKLGLLVPDDAHIYHGESANIGDTSAVFVGVSGAEARPEFVLGKLLAVELPADAAELARLVRRTVNTQAGFVDELVADQVSAGIERTWAVPVYPGIPADAASLATALDSVSTVQPTPHMALLIGYN